MDEIFGKKTFALLVDGDNAQPSLLQPILLEVAKYGRITIRRIYGDWTLPAMGRWREATHECAMQPVHQFRNTTGKNATDSALIIDAIDLLNKKLVDGFCLVSSDSDFTRLATRIREDGLFVVGVGEKHTPAAFVNACDVFVYTENLRKNDRSNGKAPSSSAAPKKPTAQRPGTAADRPQISAESMAMLRKLVKQGLAANTSSDGWMNLGAFGSVLRTINPAFDPRSYGHAKLSTLVETLPDLLELKQDDTRVPPTIYIKLRRGSE